MLLVPFKIAPGGHWTNAAGGVLALMLIAREYYVRHRGRVAAQPTP
jgi:hypothetical protein